MRLVVKQMGEQVELFPVARGKTGVPALGGQGLVSARTGHKEGLAQAGPRREHGPDRAGPGRAGVERMQIARREQGRAQGRGHQVVDQPDLPETMPGRQLAGIERPGKVGQGDCLVDHRPGHADTGAGRNHPLPGKKPGQQVVEVPVGTVLHGPLAQWPAGLVVETKRGLGRADIPGQQDVRGSHGGFHPSLSRRMSQASERLLLAGFSTTRNS